MALLLKLQRTLLGRKFKKGIDNERCVNMLNCMADGIRKGVAIGGKSDIEVTSLVF